MPYIKKSKNRIPSKVLLAKFGVFTGSEFTWLRKDLGRLLGKLRLCEFDAGGFPLEVCKAKQDGGLFFSLWDQRSIPRSCFLSFSGQIYTEWVGFIINVLYTRIVM